MDVPIKLLLLLLLLEKYKYRLFNKRFAREGDEYHLTAATVVCSAHFRQEDTIRKLLGRWDLSEMQLQKQIQKCHGKYFITAALCKIFICSSVYNAIKIVTLYSF